MIDIYTTEESGSVVATPERALWRAVIIQAMREAMDFDWAAIRWLLEPGRDVALVCSWAGYEHEYVAPRMRDLVVLNALAHARRRAPIFDRARKSVVFKRPSKGKAEKAIAFLRSDLGKKIRFSCNLPIGPRERESILAKAVRAAEASA